MYCEEYCLRSPPGRSRPPRLGQSARVVLLGPPTCRNDPPRMGATASLLLFRSPLLFFLSSSFLHGASSTTTTITSPSIRHHHYTPFRHLFNLYQSFLLFDAAREHSPIASSYYIHPIVSTHNSPFFLRTDSKRDWRRVRPVSLSLVSCSPSISSP